MTEKPTEADKWFDLDSFWKDLELNSDLFSTDEEELSAPEDDEDDWII